MDELHSTLTRDILAENAPEAVEHCCPCCLRVVPADAHACDHCARRFEGRGRYERLAESPASIESVSLLEAKDAATERR